MKHLLAFLVWISLCLPCTGQTMGWIGYRPDDITFTFLFNTLNASTGAPGVVSGLTIAAYKSGSDTELTTGVTLNTNVDSLLGMHRVTIDPSQNGFTNNSTFYVVCTAGTIDGNSAVGRIVAAFTLGAPTIVYELENSQIGTDVTTIVSRTNPVSPFTTVEGHTWTFANGVQIMGKPRFREYAGLVDALFAMDFDKVLPKDVTISSATLVSVSPSGPTVDSPLSLSPNKRQVHMIVDIPSAGTYTFGVKVTTTDSQQIIRKGVIIVE